MVLAAMLTTLPAVHLAPATAWAENADDLRKAEALATEAKLLFQQKLFTEAAEKFFEAYTLAKRGSLIFNAARAHEEAKNYAKSVAYFKAYLGQPDATPDGKKDAEARIARMEAELETVRKAQEAKEKEAQRVAEEQRKREEAVRLEAKRKQEEAQRKLDEARQKDEARRAEEARKADAARKSDTPGVVKPAESGRTIPLVPSIATGAALVLTGVFYGVALSEAGTARDMEGDVVDTKTKNAYLSTVESAQTWRNVAIAGGVVTAGLAGWTVWSWYNSDSKSTVRQWQLIPGPGDAGLGLVGHF